VFAPSVVAWASRASEKYADRVAADLGYGVPLWEVFTGREVARVQSYQGIDRTPLTASQPIDSARLRAPRSVRSIGLEHCWVVDLGCEDGGRVGRCSIATTAAMQVGAGHELTHPGSCRENLKIGGPLPRVASAAFDGERTQGVEAVAFDPKPGIRQPDAAHARLGDPAHRRLRVSAAVGDEAFPACGESLPARVTELERQSVGMVVCRGGGVRVSLGQVDVRE
jgi:hypothetical protein